MIYWDSSALVAAFIPEVGTTKVRLFATELKNASSYTAILTPLEIQSAIQRKLKERSLTQQQADDVSLQLVAYRKLSQLILMDQNVLDLALHLQTIYSLKVADSIQLASARAGAENPSQTHFLCLDNRLNEAAKREGFNVPF